MQRLAEATHASALEAMKRYVAHRQATYEAFARMDPNSSQTADAQALLETAQRQLQDMAGAPDVQSTGDTTV